MNNLKRSISNLLKTFYQIARSGEEYEQPDRRVHSFLDIDMDLKKEHNIRHLIIDLDQTLVIQGTPEIPNDYLEHLLYLKRHFGKNNICFLTNEPNKEREKQIEERTEIHVVSGEFRKPAKEAYLEALIYLHAQPDKTSAVIGDRVWTDIFGANRIGLFTIQVNPLSPHKENKATSLVRRGEKISQQFGILGLVSLIGSICSLAGMGLIQLSIYLYELILNAGKITELYGIIQIINPIFLGLSLIFYVTIIVKNAKFGIGEYPNQIIRWFNTYPLFLRFLLSSILLILTWGFPSLLPEDFSRISYFYSFFVHSALLLSLTKIYRSDIGRFFRIVFDIGIIGIITSNLPSNLGMYFLVLLMIPIGTASRYFKTEGTIMIFLACCGLTLYLLGGFHSHTYIFILLYATIALTIKFEYKEIVYPFDVLLSLLFKKDIRTLNVTEILQIFAKIMNCQAVFFIENLKKGYYYIHYGNEEFGKINELSNEEVYNYLIRHSEYIFSYEKKPSDEDLSYKQNNLINGLQPIIRPPLQNGLSSVIAVQLPHGINQFLIFSNILTRNGAAKSRFSTRHIRLMYLFSNILSLKHFAPSG